MPHIEPTLIVFAVLCVVGFALWRATQGGSNAGEIERSVTAGMFAAQSNQWPEAQTHLEHALLLMEREKTLDIPKMVSCMLRLAECYERTGLQREAAQIFPAVLKTWEHYMVQPGASMVDIDFAATHSDFGRGTNDVANFYLTKVIPFRERKLPKGHPDTLNSYVIAVRLLRKLGRNGEADKLEAKTRGRTS